MKKHEPNLPAERSVIGSVMMRPEVLARVSLAPADFFHPMHRKIWRAILDAARTGDPLDRVVIASQGIDEGVLSDCITAVPTAENVDHYAALVAEAAIDRQLREALSEATGTMQGRELLEAVQRATLSADRRVVDAAAGFASASDRVATERVEREQIVQRGLAFHVSFLDDILRGMLAHDVVLMGARTGAGKTQLATIIAQTNAEAGRRVHYLALEAEPKEIERRAKYRVIANLCWERNRPERHRLNYADWFYGRFPSLADVEAEADRLVRERLRTLKTYYRGSSFGADDIAKRFAEIRHETDLIILDHFHYVDLDAEKTENAAAREIVMRIRDSALAIGVPVVVIAHLRKRDRMSKAIVPDLEEFHGASDLTKVVTKAVLLAPAKDQPRPAPFLAPTYMYCPKDRVVGTQDAVALINFSMREGGYETAYELGRVGASADKWTPLHELPEWAGRASRPDGAPGPATPPPAPPEPTPEDLDIDWDNLGRTHRPRPEHDEFVDRRSAAAGDRDRDGRGDDLR